MTGLEIAIVVLLATLYPMLWLHGYFFGQRRESQRTAKILRRLEERIDAQPVITMTTAPKPGGIRSSSIRRIPL